MGKSRNNPKPATPFQPRRVLVALWMPGVFGGDVMDGIHEWLRESGARWRIRFADSAKLFDSSLVWMMRGKSLDGVISAYHTPEQLDALRRARIPAILFGEHLVDSQPDEPLPPLLACVELDIAAVARAAADHLLSRAGFRSAGYVESYFDHGWSRHRGDAVVAEFHRRGLDTRRFFHYGKPSPSVAKSGPDFDGLAAWLRDIPKPAAMMDGKPAPLRSALRYSCTPIAKRGSTASTPSIGEIVQKALDYIDANACSGATLDDVVRHCCYSRTLVTMRFRQMTGMSVVQAIRNRKLEEAKRLLRETTLSAEEIAAICGYESASTLSRAFSRANGLSPGLWRRTAAPSDS